MLISINLNTFRFLCYKVLTSWNKWTLLEESHDTIKRNSHIHFRILTNFLHNFTLFSPLLWIAGAAVVKFKLLTHVYLQINSPYTTDSFYVYVEWQASYISDEEKVTLKLSDLSK